MFVPFPLCFSFPHGSPEYMAGAPLQTRCEGNTLGVGEQQNRVDTGEPADQPWAAHTWTAAWEGKKLQSCLSHLFRVIWASVTATEPKS